MLESKHSGDGLIQRAGRLFGYWCSLLSLFLWLITDSFASERLYSGSRTEYNAIWSLLANLRAPTRMSCTPVLEPQLYETADLDLSPWLTVNGAVSVQLYSCTCNILLCYFWTMFISGADSKVVEIAFFLCLLFIHWKILCQSETNELVPLLFAHVFFAHLHTASQDATPECR